VKEIIAKTVGKGENLINVKTRIGEVTPSWFDSSNLPKLQVLAISVDEYNFEDILIPICVYHSQTPQEIFNEYRDYIIDPDWVQENYINYLNNHPNQNTKAQREQIYQNYLKHLGRK
jgi:hypothetical protein